MTANLVNGFSPMQDLIPQAAAKANQNSQSDFSEVLKSSTAKENGTAKQDIHGSEKNAKSTTKVDDKAAQESKVDSSSDKTAKTDDSVKTDKAQTVDQKTNEDGLTDEQMEEVAEVVATMVQTIAEVLDVPVDQVTEAIEALGLEDMQVIDSAVIPELVVELTDASDTMDIMTDENIYSDVKELMAASDNLMNELATELDVPVDELKDLISHKVEELKGDGDEKIVVDTTASGFEVVTETDSEKLPEVGAAKQNTDSRDAKGDDRSGQASEGMGFANSVIDSLRNAVSEVQDNAQLSYTSGANQTEEIMNQITDSIRATMKDEVTEMEMQLHPASLGNVRVQVASRDGVITANFTTQNEQVRAALEAQVVQLKEQLNEQGIKVEAIEVTVSSHAFERNLNEEGERGQSQNEAEAKRKRVRGINLSEMTLDDMEDIDEEDRVTADMMARAGNTVDYMA